MAVLELSIKETYVPNWSIWECVREFVQNALDENDRGYPCTIEYEGGALRVYNDGADMSVRSLILGEGDKAKDEKMRGQHSEGLALAMLAGLRAKLRISVRTKSEKWVPAIQMSDTYGTKVLVIKTRKQRVPFTGVEVTIGITETMWKRCKRRFIPLVEMNPKDILVTEDGTILLDPTCKGMLFVKGIYVQTRKDFQHGYDLLHVKLDRDRGLLEDFNVKWRIADMYTQAARKDAHRTGDIVYPLLKLGVADVAGFYESNTGSELKGQVKARFIAEHGKDAIPVTTMGQSNEAGHLGRVGVVVNERMDTLLKGEVESLPDLRLAAKKDVEETYSWHDLDNEEKASLTYATELIDTVRQHVRDNPEICKVLDVISNLFLQEGAFIDCVNVVRFSDADILGRWTRKTGMIELARHVLTHRVRTLRVLIHEEVHRVLGEHDSSALHTHSVELYWMMLFYVNTTLNVGND